MFRLLLLPFTLAIAALAGKPADYSTDMVMLQDGRIVETMKLYVSGQKSRVEGFPSGPLGRTASIARKDRGVMWTLYLDKKQYTEKELAAASRPGKPDLSNFDLANLKKENLGRETILGHACTKMRVIMGNLPGGRPMVATVWVADNLELPLRLETIGITQENRNLRIEPQPAGLFEIPAGFTKISVPGKPASGFRGQIGGERIPQALIGGKNAPVAARTQSPAASAWKLEMNVNRNGEDYRDFVPTRASAIPRASACDKDSRRKAWTWVKDEHEPPTGHCWLKNNVPEPGEDGCCVSGVKR